MGILGNVSVYLQRKTSSNYLIFLRTMLKNIKLVIIDLDDTLVAFNEVKEEAWKESVEIYAQKYPLISREVLYNTIIRQSEFFWSDPERHRIGRLNIDKARRLMMKDVFVEMNLDESYNSDFLADLYSEIRIKKMFLYDDAHEILHKIKCKGFKTALMTNGDSKLQRYKIERFQLEKYFDHIFIEEEVGFGKPEKRAFLNVLSKFSISPEEAIILGDNLKWEVEIPQSMGITSIWVNQKNMKKRKGNDPLPKFEINKLADLKNILDI